MLKSIISFISKKRIVFVAGILFVFGTAQCIGLDRRQKQKVLSAKDTLVLTQDYFFLMEIAEGIRYVKKDRAQVVVLSRNLSSLEREVGEVLSLLNHNRGIKNLVVLGHHILKKVIAQASSIPPRIKLYYGGVPYAQTLPLLERNRRFHGIELSAGILPHCYVLHFLKPNQQKRMLVFYSEEAVRRHIDMIRPKAKSLGVSIVAVRTTPETFRYDFHEVNGKKADAIYMAMDPIYSYSIFKELRDYARKKKIMFSSDFRVLTEEGALFSFHPSYFYIGFQMGQWLRNHFTKKQLFGYFPRKNYLAFNQKLLKEFGLTLPERLKKASMIGKLQQELIDLYRQNETYKMRLVLDRLLLIDPHNPLALAMKNGT